MIDVILQSHRGQKVKRVGKTENTEGDRPIKSLLKTISWRVIGTLDTMTISYVITGEIKSAISIGSIEVFSKMILYYFHERLWTKVREFEKK